MVGSVRKKQRVREVVQGVETEIILVEKVIFHTKRFPKLLSNKNVKNCIGYKNNHWKHFLRGNRLDS